jgi:hypothetical protein
MRRPHSALLRARALLIAGLVVVGPSLLAAGPVAAGRGTAGAVAAGASDARGGPRTLARSVKLHGAAGSARAENRPARHVVARALPKATGKEKAYSSKHPAPAIGAARGSGSGSSKAPSSFPTTALAPTPATVTTTNPATEATSGAGTAQATAEPPDAAVAVGPEHVVQATNEGIRITNRSLGSATSTPLFNFFGLDFDPDYQAATFDPHVIFDSVHNRWIATEASFDCVPDPDFDIFVGTGYIDIAVSDTADPTGGWSILSAPYPDTVPDYPGLGTSTDKIVVSANVFPLVASGGLGCDIDEDHFVGTELDAVSWAQMLGSGVVDVAYLTDYLFPVDYGHYGDPVNDLAASLDYFTMRPAVQAPAASATVFGVGLNILTNGKPSAFKVTGLPSSGTTAVTIADVASLDPFDADPPAPAQPGGTIASAVDGRPTDAVWQANRLAFVSTMTCDPAGGASGETRDCVRVSELSTATATPSVTQDLVIGETGRDLYMGGVGFSQNSDLHVVWTGSSATAGDYPSTYTAYQLSGQTANTLTGKQKIASGTAKYVGQPPTVGAGTRWGDYVTVAQDPQVPDAVWQADEYSVGTWATRVSQLRTFQGASYTPIAPVRIMDSRTPGIGIPTPTMFTANVPQKFKVRGAFGIPAGAVAVTGNIGVVGQQVAGYVSVTPTSTTAPTTSTINFPLKDVRANNFTLPIGADGNLWAVFKGSSGKKTHLFVDITGYFVAGTSGATYQPITPVTRMGNSIDGSGGLTKFTGGTLSQQLILAGVGPIPADATAVTGNVTITRQTTGGFISVTKDAPSFPLTTSTLNFPKGDNRANGLTAALNANGGIWITLSIPTTATADVLVDITGYYKNGGGGKLFYPLTPGRPLDTRAGVVLSGLTGAFAAQPPPPTGLTNARTLTVGGHWGVPAGATAITGNITVAGQTQAGFVSLTPAADNNPGTSTINFPLGDVRANGVTSPLSGGSLGLVYRSTVGKSTHLILDVTGYFQ